MSRLSAVFTAPLRWQLCWTLSLIDHFTKGPVWFPELLPQYGDVAAKLVVGPARNRALGSALAQMMYVFGQLYVGCQYISNIQI